MNLRFWVTRFEFTQYQQQVAKDFAKMSAANQTTDQAVADLTAAEAKQATDLAKLKTDVATALAGIQSGGTLTDAQQASVNALKAAMGVDDATIEGIDTTVQPPAPPAAA